MILSRSKDSGRGVDKEGEISSVSVMKLELVAPIAERILLMEKTSRRIGGSNFEQANHD
jgi:hypothetical protein